MLEHLLSSFFSSASHADHHLASDHHHCHSVSTNFSLMDDNFGGFATELEKLPPFDFDISSIYKKHDGPDGDGGYHDARAQMDSIVIPDDRPGPRPWMDGQGKFHAPATYSTINCGRLNDFVDHLNPNRQHFDGEPNYNQYVDKLHSQCIDLPTQFKCRCNYGLLMDLLGRGYFRKMDIQRVLPAIGFTVVEKPDAASAPVPHGPPTTSLGEPMAQ
eukprot:gene586-1005_t